MLTPQEEIEELKRYEDQLYRPFARASIAASRCFKKNDKGQTMFSVLLKKYLINSDEVELKLRKKMILLIRWQIFFILLFGGVLGVIILSYLKAIHALDQWNTITYLFLIPFLIISVFVSTKMVFKKDIEGMRLVND